MKLSVKWHHLLNLAQPLFYQCNGSCRSSNENTWLVFIALSLLLVLPLAPSDVRATEDAPVILRAKACGSCHVIPGVKDAYGKAGPSLKGLSERKRIVGRTLKNNPENMKVWLKNPKSVMPGTMMPNMGLTDEEIEVLIVYFDTI